MVRDSKGHGVYELRAKPDSSEMDSLNVKEAGGLPVPLHYLFTAPRLCIILHPRHSACLCLLMQHPLCFRAP